MTPAEIAIEIEYNRALLGKLDTAAASIADIEPLVEARSFVISKLRSYGVEIEG